VGEIIEEMEIFAKSLPSMAPLVGLDLGTVTLGVAVSDVFLSVATPLETIKRKKFGVDAAALLAIMSTVAAERALLEADTSRKRRAEVIDHVAAGYILQGALDRIRHIRQSV
jgi:putative Holliday junction resolvase